MLKTTNKQIIQEVPWGMLVWECEDGSFAGDEEGNFMHVFVSNQDQARMQAATKALADAAKHYGVYDGGKPVFWAGKRPIDDEELQHQQARAAAGLIPDPLDIAAIREEERALHGR